MNHLLLTRIILDDVTTDDEKQENIKLYHETKSLHRGITENIVAIKKQFYWPNLETDTKNYVKSCKICQKSRQVNLETDPIRI